MSDDEYDKSNINRPWKGLTLTPIKEAEDGSNNYNEFKTKAESKLEAAGYWRYIDGVGYKPPTIPTLVQSSMVKGLDTQGVEQTLRSDSFGSVGLFRVPGQASISGAGRACFC